MKSVDLITAWKITCKREPVNPSGTSNAIPKRIYEGFTCVTLTSNFTPTYIQPEEYYVKMVNGDKFFWQKINIIKLKIGSKRNKK